MSAEETITEEEIQNGEAKPGKNNFSRKMENALRRSKRMLSGKRRSIKNSTSIEKENVEPSSPKKDPSFDDERIQSTDTTDTNGEVSPRARRPSQTFFGSERQVEIDGRKIKEIEIVGEKSNEPIDMKKQKKLVRKKSLDQSELNVACRDLGKADFEGWLQKKSGGHGIVPVSWKRYWSVIKGGKLYCYKTSFDIAADYAIVITCYTVEKAEEKKKKTAFKLVPTTEDFKQAVFAADSETDLNGWIEILNKVLSGIDISQTNDNAVPEYEDRHRMYSSNTRPKDESALRGGSIRHKQRLSSAFAVETETTGMPAGFGARTQSTSQPRVRKGSSSGGAKPESCLAVGSMFKSIDVDEDESGSPEEDADVKTLLYKEVEIISETPATEKEVEIAKLNAEIAKLNDDMLVLNKDGVRKSPEVTPEVVRSTAVPVIHIDESSKPEEVVDQPVISEDTLEVTDKKSGQERTTSQIFRDFEAATEGDPEHPVEEVQHEVQPAKVPPPAPEEAANEDVQEEPEAPAENIERPPVVEEEQVIAIRKSSEIDAETVITELEQQHKKEEQEAAEENAPPVDAVTESNAPIDAPAASDDNEIIVTDIPMNIVPEDEDGDDVEDKPESIPKEGEEQSGEPVPDKEEQSGGPVPYIEEQSVTDTKELKPESAEETQESAQEETEATEVAKQEEIVSEVTETLPLDESATEPPTESQPTEVATPVAPVEDETKAEASEEVKSEPSEPAQNDKPDVEESTGEESVGVNQSSESTENDKPVEEGEPKSDANVEDTKSEAVESGPSQPTQEDKPAETTEEDKPAEEEPESKTNVADTKSEAVESEPSEPAQADETTEATKTTEEKPSEIEVETTVEITTETVIVDDNQEPIETKPKSYSVDLGEDLELPNLNMGDTSLSDEISIQLSSPPSETDKSFTIVDNKPQVNGDAVHVISVN